MRVYYNRAVQMLIIEYKPVLECVYSSLHSQRKDPILEIYNRITIGSMLCYPCIRPKPLCMKATHCPSGILCLGHKTDFKSGHWYCYWLLIKCLVKAYRWLESTIIYWKEYQGPDSIKSRLIKMGNPILEIRRSQDRLISTIGFPLLVRRHLYIESGPRVFSRY